MIPDKLKKLIEQYCMGIEPTNAQMDEILDLTYSSNADPSEVSAYIKEMESGPTRAELDAAEAKRRAREAAERKAEEERKAKAEREAKEEAARRAREEQMRRVEEKQKHIIEQEALEKAKEAKRLKKLLFGMIFAVIIIVLGVTLIDRLNAPVDTETALKSKYDNVIKRHRYFEIERNGVWGICDLDGNVKIEPKYDEIISPHLSGWEGIAIEVKKNGKLGLVSEKGLTEICAPKYDDIGDYNNFNDLVLVKNDGKLGLFSSSKGVEVAPTKYNKIHFDGKYYKVEIISSSGKVSHHKLNSDGSLKK